MRHCRVLFRLSGAFSRRQFSADYTISMFGFDFRQGQAARKSLDFLDLRSFEHAQRKYLLADAGAGIERTPNFAPVLRYLLPPGRKRRVAAPDQFVSSATRSGSRPPHCVLWRGLWRRSSWTARSRKTWRSTSSYRLRARPMAGPFVMECSAAFASISPSTTRGPRALDPRAFPRSRAIPPPRILSDEELASLIAACSRVSPTTSPSGANADDAGRVVGEHGLAIRRSASASIAPMSISSAEFCTSGRPSFARIALSRFTPRRWRRCAMYARHRDAAFPAPKDCVFFLSSRGNRLSKTGLLSGVRRGLQACRSRQWQAFEAA